MTAGWRIISARVTRGMRISRVYEYAAVSTAARCETCSGLGLGLGLGLKG